MSEWGQPWGGDWLDQDGVTVVLRRKGQRCRFFKAGEQVGPEHHNVYPAVVWAYASTEWFDPTDPILSLRCREEVRANSRPVSGATRHPAAS